MNGKPNLDSRSDEQIMDDVIACLRIVEPKWLGWYDDPTLVLHVRETLDEMEALARAHGHASSGCMTVTYDADSDKVEWTVVVAYRFGDYPSLEGEEP